MAEPTEQTEQTPSPINGGCDQGWCPHCGDCLACYGDETCAIAGIPHDEV